MRRAPWGLVAVAAVWACGGQTAAVGSTPSPQVSLFTE
jgi:hypothetical protein